MDEFAIEYFQKLKILTQDFDDRRQELGRSRIKLFVAAVTRQIIDFKENFDLIIGAGNSGLFIPEKLYTEIKKDIPDISSHNHAIAVVVGSALKRIKNSIPFYDNSIESSIHNSSYENEKKALLDELQTFINSAIEEYKAGKIFFRF